MKKLALALTAGFIAAACVQTASAQSAKLNPESAQDTVKINRKIMCSLVDDEPITYYWFGRAYSRRTGEADKHMFNVEGMNIRSCSAVEDADRGMGYKLVSREILLYRDPESNKVLKTWDNPWTGEEVEVYHVANDPVNFTSYEKGRDGKPSIFGGHFLEDGWHMTTTVPLFYPNPLASEYQAEIGGTYHATEMFNFMGNRDDLLDPNKNTAEVHVGWVRMSDWLPWMKMQGRDGVIYMHTAGRKLDSWDAMPDGMKNEILTHYPDYVAPPPADDPRSNETSWKYYKSVKTGEKSLPNR